MYLRLREVIFMNRKFYTMFFLLVASLAHGAIENDVATKSSQGLASSVEDILSGVGGAIHVLEVAPNDKIEKSLDGVERSLFLIGKGLTQIKKALENEKGGFFSAIGRFFQKKDDAVEKWTAALEREKGRLKKAMEEIFDFIAKRAPSKGELVINNVSQRISKEITDEDLAYQVEDLWGEEAKSLQNKCQKGIKTQAKEASKEVSKEYRGRMEEAEKNRKEHERIAKTMAEEAKNKAKTEEMEKRLRLEREKKEKEEELERERLGREIMQAGAEQDKEIKKLHRARDLKKAEIMNYAEKKTKEHKEKLEATIEKIISGAKKEKEIMSERIARIEIEANSKMNSLKEEFREKQEEEVYLFNERIDVIELEALKKKEKLKDEIMRIEEGVESKISSLKQQYDKDFDAFNAKLENKLNEIKEGMQLEKDRLSKSMLILDEDPRVRNISEQIKDFAKKTQEEALKEIQRLEEEVNKKEEELLAKKLKIVEKVQSKMDLFSKKIRTPENEHLFRLGEDYAYKPGGPSPYPAKATTEEEVGRTTYERLSPQAFKEEMKDSKSIHEDKLHKEKNELGGQEDEGGLFFGGFGNSEIDLSTQDNENENE